MKLTNNNYFKSDNNYLSNSKVSDWLKCKNYFKSKHIDHTITQPVTDPMIIGSAVDTWLTESEEKFNEQYIVMSRRNRKADTPWRYQLTPSMYNQVESMCKNAEQSPVIKQFRKEKYIAQEIVQVDLELNHFKGLCGIPDWYKIEGDTIIIPDLKTTQTIEPVKYHYKCMSLGYYRQQAFYQILLGNKYDKHKFVSYHVAIEKDTEGIYKVVTFLLNQERIEDEKENLYKIFKDIKNEKKFSKHQATLENAFEIGGYE